jgi:hypothetical protein
MKYPALHISAATTELVKGILTLYPQAQIVPRLTPLEDEDISLEVRLPLCQDDIYEARDQIHAFVIQLQEQYDVLILASAVPVQRRQLYLTRDGRKYHETGLGEKRVLGTGDVLIAEDLTGKGHVTRSIGGDTRVTLSVPLAEV